MQWCIHSILFVVVINILQEQMKKKHSKIDHVELLKDSLSYCTVHIVRWNVMWNVFFLMESRTLTVSDFQAECLLNKVADSYTCIYKGCYQHTYMLILDEQS